MFTPSPILRSMETKDARTLNQCVTNSTSSDALIDLFFQIGAMRGNHAEDIQQAFQRAFNKNPLIALRIAFYSRDIRGGQGERHTFRLILEHLAANSPEVVKHNIRWIPFFGRWDDLFTLFDTTLETDALNIIATGLQSEDGLCAKWMPREKSSKKNIAIKIREHMSLSSKEYRKLLSRLTNVVESDMCRNEWDSIEYSHVPSLAMRNYSDAFRRHSPLAWTTYTTALALGNTKVNASVLYPHDICRPLIQRWNEVEVDNVLLQAQWDALPNWLVDSTERILPVVDTSGSMFMGYNSSSKLQPIDVSVSLGLYIAERNIGPFKDHFITFSEEPQLQKIEGDSLQGKVHSLRDASWGYNTNIQKVFHLLLESAKRDEINQANMPTMVLILSDMEFDQACNPNHTAMEAISFMYEDAGYQMPKIVFWNLDAKTPNFPVKFDKNDTALISGFSPSILVSLLSGESLTPQSVMLRTVNNPRYDPISIPAV